MILLATENPWLFDNFFWILISALVLLYLLNVRKNRKKDETDI